MKENMTAIDEIQELYNRREPLCDELAAHLETDRSFPKLRHPLLYAVPYSESMNAVYNKQYEVREQQARQLKEDGDWHSYIFTHERPYRLEMFVSIMDEIKSNSEYWQILGEVWIDSENIWQNGEVWQELLTADRSEKENFMDSASRQAFKLLPKKLTVYRGYKVGKNEYDFSWTLNKERAQWFANRFRGEGAVKEMTIAKSRVFAYLTGRNEQEVIII